MAGKWDFLELHYVVHCQPTRDLLAWPGASVAVPAGMPRCMCMLPFLHCRYGKELYLSTSTSLSYSDRMPC